MCMKRKKWFLSLTDNEGKAYQYSCSNGECIFKEK